LENQHNSLSPSDLPFCLPDEFGEIVATDEECPGVYYVATRLEKQIGDMATEYYVINTDATAISAKAKSYCQKLSEDSAFLIISLDIPDNGHAVIDYEICRYRVRNGIPIADEHSLLTFARYGAEDHPEYFGELPPPLSTPWGNMTRYQRLTTGVFWLETDLGKECLCVCAGLWEIELSESTQQLATLTEQDKRQGLEATEGYAFYLYEDACLPLFELEPSHPDLDEHCDHSALMNAIWKYHPDYATAWNMREMSGLNDMPGMLMRSAGMDVELRGSVDRTIRITEGRSCEFLRLDE
jgi:hypothetical protein